VANRKKSIRPGFLVQLKALGLLIFSVSIPVLGFIYIFFPPQNYNERIADIFLENPLEEVGLGVKMPVVSMRFFPVIEDRLDASISGVSYNLSFMQSKVDRLDRELVTNLNNASKNFLDYKIINSFEILEPAGDYNAILTAKNLGKDICEYVDKDGVKEFWIWMYENDQIAPIGFNLSASAKSKKFWDKPATKLPTCQASYTVYEYNWNQETEDALYSHVQNFEAILKFVDEKDSPLFWGNFVGADAIGNIVKPGCGWSDMPPNAIMEGDYSNETSILSDCLDWKPDGTGGKQPINCSAWNCTSLGFFNWYLQNIPGKDNSLIYGNKKLRNWWEFIADFDYALTGGKSLTTILLAKSPKPSPVLGESIVSESTPSSELTQEFQEDGVVNAYDWAFILNNWGKAGASDLNHDNTTDEKDLQKIMENYGKTSELFK